MRLDALGTARAPQVFRHNLGMCCFFMAALPGQPLTACLTDTPRGDLLRGVGRWMGLYHGASGDARVPLDMPDHPAELQEKPPHDGGGGDPARLAALVARAPAIFARDQGRPVLHGFCHNDLSPGNILIDADGTGVIDFELATPGWQMRDVARFVLQVPGQDDAYDIWGDLADISAGYGRDLRAEPGFMSMLTLELAYRLARAPRPDRPDRVQMLNRLHAATDALLSAQP